MVNRNSIVCVVVGTLSVGMFAASSVDAGVIGHRWDEIDNSTSSAPGNSATGLNDGSLDGTIYRTFDLYLQVTSNVTIIDSGFTQSAGPNAGVQITNTNYFQFKFTGGGVSNAPPLPDFFSMFPLLEYDSYVGMGDLLGTQIGQQSLTFNNSDLQGTWFASGGTSGIPNEAGEVFAGRFTVASLQGFGTDESADRFLGGQLYVALQVPQGQIPITTVVNLSNAFATIPSPGAMPLAVLTGLAALRRRRN